MTKKILAVVLSILMVFSVSPTAVFAAVSELTAAEAQEQAGQQELIPQKITHEVSEGKLSKIEVNPAFEGIFTEEDIAKEIALIEASKPRLQKKVYSYGQEFLETEEAAQYVREQLLARSTSISFQMAADGILTSSGEIWAAVDPAIDGAFIEDDDHTGGDWLRYSYGGTSTKIDDYFYDYEENRTLLYVSYTLSFFVTPEEYAMVEARLPEVYEELDLANAGSDVEKVQRIFHYITTNIRYDYAALDNPDENIHGYTAYGGLILGTCVCQGYALLLYRMCRDNGINARMIVGDGGSPAKPEKHAWDIVEIDGAYYLCDATWDEHEGGGRYTYFLRGSSDFDRTSDNFHRSDSEFNTEAFKAQYPISETCYKAPAHTHVDEDADAFCDVIGCFAELYVDRTWSNGKVVETLRAFPETYTTIKSGTVSADGSYDFSGWYVIDGTVSAGRPTINNANGEPVRIILRDGSKFSITKGINLLSGNDLYIYGQSKGTGSMNVSIAYDGYAGIGGGQKNSAGNLTVVGGNVEVTGGKYASGIGGGYTGTGGGNFTIYGGSVKATGGERGAGIGGGYQCGLTSFKFYGGKVEAISDSYAVGIGAGNGSSSHGTFDVYSSDVNIKSGASSARTSSVTASTYSSNRKPYVLIQNKAAKIGSTGYDTLASAVSAASTSNTVTLLADSNENITLAEGKSFKLDKNGYLYTGTVSSASNKFVVKKTVDGNGIITYSLAHKHSFAFTAGADYITATCGNNESACDLTDRKITLTLTANGGTYDGETAFAAATNNAAVSFTATTGAKIGAITYNVKGSTETTASAPVNAGTYVASVKVTYGSNQSATLTKEFTVAKAMQAITADAVQYVEYGDTDKSVIASNIGNVPMTYAVKSGDSVTVDSETGALTVAKCGSTVITVTVAETDNSSGATKDITITVNEKKIAKPTADTTVFTYTAESQTYNPVGFDAATMEISGNVQTNANETGYTVTVTPKTNYKWSTEGDCTFTWKISKADYTGEKTAGGELNGINGSTAEVALPAIPDGAVYGTAKASIENVAASVSGATLSLETTAELSRGIKSFTVTVGVTGADNYKDYDITATVTVIPAPHTHSYTYGVDAEDSSVLTATCIEYCDGEYDKTPLRLSLAAADGAAFFRSAELAAWTKAGAAEPEIKYYKVGETEALEGAPIESGRYIARATVMNGETPVSAEINFIYHIHVKGETRMHNNEAHWYVCGAEDCTFVGANDAETLANYEAAFADADTGAKLKETLGYEIHDCTNGDCVCGVKAANTADLKAAVSDANAKIENAYRYESVENLEKVVGKVKSDFNYTEFEQDAIGKLTADIKEAIGALKWAEYDFSNYKTKLDLMQGYIADGKSVDYTKASWDNAKAKYDAIFAISPLTYEKEEAIGMACDSFENAFDNLTEAPTADYSEVEKQQDIAANLVQKAYTPESWSVLDSALKNVTAGLNENHQEEVSQMAKGIADAIAALEWADYDFSDYKTKLDLMKSYIESGEEINFEKSSWDNAKEKYEAIYKITPLTYEKEEAIVEACNVFVTAFDNLKAIIGTWARLQDRIDAAEDGKTTELKLDRSLKSTASDAAFIVAAGKDIVIDLNGFDLDADNLHRIFNIEGGKLTIMDSTAKTEGDDYISGSLKNGYSSSSIYDYTSVGGGAILVTDGGTLILNSGIIQDCQADMSGTDWVSYAGEGGGGAICLDTYDYSYDDYDENEYDEPVPCYFIMNGGIIRNCKAYNAAYTKGGGVFIYENSKFTMNGGLITECIADGDSGGGVCVNGGFDRSRFWNAEFTMNGGKITNCSAYKGGGVAMRELTTFNFNDGEISGNSAVIGGGISIDNFTILNMYGGTIINNEAEERGGGIDILISWVRIYGGIIKNNTARRGGGISTGEECEPTEYPCIPAPNGVNRLDVFGGTITENTATERGGGIEFDSTEMSIGGTAVVKNNYLVIDEQTTVNCDVQTDYNRVIALADGENAPTEDMCVGLYGVGTDVSNSSESDMAYFFASDPKNQVVIYDSKKERIRTINAVAIIGELGYATLAKAVDAVEDGGTILITGDNEETVTVSRTLTFTIDENEYSFTGEIAGGETYFVKETNRTYQVHAHTVGEAYMHNAEAHWFICTDPDCIFNGANDIETLTNYENAFADEKKGEECKAILGYEAHDYSNTECECGAIRSFKAVYEDNTLTFYYDGFDHKADGVNTILYDNLTTQAAIAGDWGYDEKRMDVVDVVIHKTLSDYNGLKSMAYMFSGMKNAGSISGAEYLNTDDVTDMSHTFYMFGCNSYFLEDIPDVSGWNTDKVTDMSYMFCNYGYNSPFISEAPDVSGWNTENVTNMSRMFFSYGAKSEILNKAPATGSWKTGKVTDMMMLFGNYAAAGKTIDEVPDVSTWNTENVTDMAYMFYGYGHDSEALSKAPATGSWKTGKVTDMSGMFGGYGYSAALLNDVPDVSTWNTENVTGMGYMFKDYARTSTAMNKVPAVNGWKTGKLTNTSSMFDGYGFSSKLLAFNLDLIGWNIEKVNDGSDMFTNSAKSGTEWSVAIPAMTGKLKNTTQKWYGESTGAVIAPAAGKTFKLSYMVQIDPNLKNGKIESNAVMTDSGKVITLTVTPDAGCALVPESLVVSYTDGTVKTCKLTEAGENTYTFEMPAAYVTVTAKFHAHAKGTDYMYNGDAHWFVCADDDCFLSTVSDYEAAFEADNSLKTTFGYATHTGMSDFICDDCEYNDVAGAKTAAKAELAAAKTNAVSDEAKAAIDAAIENVNKATTVEAVTYAKTVGTASAKAADEALANAISEAKAALDLENAKDPLNNNAPVTAGKQSIENAKSLTAVSNAKSTAIGNIQSAQASELAGAKAAAKPALDTENAKDPLTDNSSVTTGKQNIDNAATKANVENAKNAALNNIKTAQATELANAKAAAKSALDAENAKDPLTDATAFNEGKKSIDNAATKAAVASAKDTAISNVQAAQVTELAENAKADAKSALAAAKRKAVSDEAKAAIDAAVENVEKAASKEAVENAKKSGIENAAAADKALAEAVANAKADLAELKGKVVSDEAKAAIDEAVKNVEKAVGLDGVAAAKKAGADNAAAADKALADAKKAAIKYIEDFAGDDASEEIKNLVKEISDKINAVTNLNDVAVEKETGTDNVDHKQREEGFTVADTSIELGYREEAPVNAESTTNRLIYTSSDESVVTVDENGNLKAVGKGSCKVTVTLEGTDISEEIEVNVSYSLFEGLVWHIRNLLALIASGLKWLLALIGINL